MTRSRLPRVAFFIVLFAFPGSLHGGNPGLPDAAHAQDAAAAASSAEDREYAVGPEDVVKIQVWNRPDLGDEVVVDGSGFATLPLIGRVPFEGKTPTELADDLRSRYAIVDPLITEVSVTVTQYNSRHVTVVGEVRTPGRYVFREIPDLWQIILGAGGPTPTADMSRVQIVRKNPEPGEQQTQRVDLSRGIENVELATLPALRPRDTVMISSLAGETVSGTRIHVLGAVRNPGIYPLSGAESVVEAIALSGGTLPGADLGRIRLNRQGGSGAVVYELDVEGYLDDGRPAADFTLRAGDTITVPGGGTLGSIIGAVIRYVPLVTSVTGLIIALGR
jgi:polysaccharide export outer membrane protein